MIYLNNQPKLTAKQARWVSYINLFNYSIGYREDKTNKVADGLSRQYSSEIDVSPERLQIDLNLNFLIESKEIQLSRARLQFECSNMVISIESPLIEQIRTAQLKDQLLRKLLKVISLHQIVEVNLELIIILLWPTDGILYLLIIFYEISY